MTANGRTPARRTYSRIESGRRIPTEYEVVSSDLHYNYPLRFELDDDNPVIAWYYRHREGSRLRADNWEAFGDPRRTTYHGYTELQDRKEDVIDGLLRQIDDTSYDERISAGWLTCLDDWYAPLRFPAHALQMLAAYVAQLAPASRVTNCAAFQAADEVRRLQRIAYRTTQLAGRQSDGRAADHRSIWEEAEQFQPLRELFERALVTYDWGEAFVLTNLMIKPHFDRLVNAEIAGTLAEANGDPILRGIHFSLDEDARWHREWTAALLQIAIADTPANAEVVSEWVDRWRPLTVDAVAALASVAAQAPVPLDPAAITGRVTTACARELAELLPAL
jgi:toluene monooxygenase system protein E